MLKRCEKLSQSLSSNMFILTDASNQFIKDWVVVSSMTLFTKAQSHTFGLHLRFSRSNKDKFFI